MLQRRTTTGPNNNSRLEFFSGALTVAFGLNKFSAPRQIRSDVSAGLKVVVLLSGSLEICVGEEGAHHLTGPSVLVIRSRENLRHAATFAADVPVRYALVQIDEPLINGALGTMLLAQEGHGSPGLGAEEHVLFARPADRTVQSLALQVLNCPIRTAERDLFVCGKALQLAAVAFGQCIIDPQSSDTRKMTPAEVDQIHAARDLLLASAHKPIAMQTLAAQVGMNVGKLNAGFRRAFGATPYKLLQEHRLAEAFRLIANGELSVSQAAYHVGYNPAHFATSFRKRFGVSPSEIR